MYDLGDRLPEPGRRSRLFRLWSAFGHDLAVDLGTANTLVYVRGKGVVLTQPSCVALDRASQRIIAVGAEAREMIGRTPATIEVIRPLRSGVIDDYEATQHMLREFILRVHHRTRFVKPRVIVCVPSGVSQIARRAVEEAVIEAGARRVVIVSEPLAAAVGAGLPIEEPRGSMIIDIGGGTTEVAVFVLGGIVAGTSEPVAGDAIDQAIVAHVRKERAILIGERMAERLKMSAAAAVVSARRVRVQFPGKDLTTGRPTRVEMTSDELAVGIAEPVSRIVDSVVSVLDRMPADIVPDLLQSGVVMTGGGALLIGLDGLVEAECGLPVRVDAEPLSCVVRGAGSLLESLRIGPPRPHRLQNLKSDGRYDSRRGGDRSRRPR